MILLSYVVMILTVYFYDYPCWHANEVSYVGSNDVLSSERFAKLFLF